MRPPTPVAGNQTSRFASAALGIALSVLLGAGCIGSDGPPQSPGGTASGTPTGTSTPCTDGETRYCMVELSEHNGVLSCAEGEELCADGTWGPCQSVGGEQTANGSGAKPMALSNAGPCLDNPCDPSCQVFDETPVDPIDAGDGGIGEWDVGDVGDLPPALRNKGLNEPCASGQDCQFNHYCYNPESGSCDHTKCAPGGPLMPGCDDCVDTICAEVDADCCAPALSCQDLYGGTPGYVQTCLDTPSECRIRFNSQTQSCTDLCAGGVVAGTCLDMFDNAGTCGIQSWDNPGCDATNYYRAICICDHPVPGAWTQECADAVYTHCGAFCPEGVSACAHNKCEVGSPLIAGCDPCVQQICAVDATCCSTAWDASCVAKVASVCSETCNPISCTDAYHTAPDFVDCDELDTECHFRMSTQNRTCNQVCAEGGGRCLDVYNNAGTCGIDWGDHLGCDNSGYASVMCMCTRPVPDPFAEFEGECRPWMPGQTDPNCAGLDLTVGVPCADGIPVCNVGNTTAQPGIEIVHFPADSGEYPECDPDLGYVGAESCVTAEAIEPGTCISMTGCPALVSGREIVVNPESSASHVAECNAASCYNNWSLYHDGPCDAPTCSGSSSEATIVPVAMYITMDKSGSMGTRGMWDPASEALKDFFASPSAANLNVTIRFYPDRNPADLPEDGCDPAACDVNACATPSVPLGMLTADTRPALGGTDQHEEDLINVVDSKGPAGYTPTHVALEGAIQWAELRASGGTSEQQVVVLITDGDPNRCGTNLDAIVQLAADAYDNFGILTYAIGLADAGDTYVDFVQDIAAAGGTGTAFLISPQIDVQQELLDALLAIQGQSVDCSFQLPNQGHFDPDLAQVLYSSGGGAPSVLPEVASAAECGQGWYYDNPNNPTQIVLCPDTCGLVQSDPEAAIEVDIPCAGLYEPATYTEIYESNCPDGTNAQWAHLAYDTVVPGDASVVWGARTAPTIADLAGTFTHLSTADAADPICPMIGPSPCPVDVYMELGGSPDAHQAVLELHLTINPTSNGAYTPTVNNWQITHSCVPDE